MTANNRRSIAISLLEDETRSLQHPSIRSKKTQSGHVGAAVVNCAAVHKKRIKFRYNYHLQHTEGWLKVQFGANVPGCLTPKQSNSRGF